MSDERVLIAKITRAGMRALFNAESNGLKLDLSHIAVGRGISADNASRGYVPTGAETELEREFSRAAIGGGDYLGDFEIMVEALMDDATAGWVHEVGVFTSDGTLFAVWSEENNPLAYKTSGVPIAIGLTLAMQEVPPDSINILVGAPNINITVIGPMAFLAASLLRLTIANIKNSNARLIPEIQSTWR